MDLFTFDTPEEVFCSILPHVLIYSILCIVSNRIHFNPLLIRKSLVLTFILGLSSFLN